MIDDPPMPARSSRLLPVALFLVLALGLVWLLRDREPERADEPSRAPAARSATPEERGPEPSVFVVAAEDPLRESAGSAPADDARLPATLPFLVSGRVVDQHGLPLPMANVSAYFVGPLGPDEEGRRLNPAFQQFPRSTRSNFDGSFALDGLDPQLALELRASLDGYGSGPAQPFTPGATDVVLVLAATATLRGSVVLDPAIPLREVTVVTLHQDSGRSRLGNGPARVRPSQAERFDFTVIGSVAGDYDLARLDPAGRFEATGLRHGTWDLLLRARSGPVELQVRDIVLRPGEVTELPPLVPAWRKIEIAVVDERREPLPMAAVFFKRREREQWLQAMAQPRPGTLSLIGDEQSLELGVSCAGYEPQRLLGVFEDREVVLRRGIEVLVKLRSERALVDGEYTVALAFEAVDRGTTEFAEDASRFRIMTFGQAQALGRAPLEGRYRLTWEGVHRTAQSLHVKGLPGSAPEYVELRRGAEPVQLDLTPPRDLMDQVRQAFEPR